MAGCCPTTSATAPCKIFTTCYDAAEISATTELLLSTTDPFVMLCTFENSRYCHTRTWPDLNVGDVACTDNSSSWIETMYTAGSLGGVSGYRDPVGLLDRRRGPAEPSESVCYDYHHRGDPHNRSLRSRYTCR
ncbi:uncharacterized protein BDV17DRAFT_272305 [Aspergillus undulatus]|uniref:uncharacterized protein n=1 Tax=Aspergillus undulatus TaxID=1810928 RepID=UPI003CCCCF03